MLKKIEKLIGLNPLDQKARLWKKKGFRKILVVWNRGLGDLPLWLYGFMWQVKAVLKEASFTFLTRENLAEGFLLLEGASVITVPNLKRSDIYDAQILLKRTKRSKDEFDVILENIEPKKWLKWQRGLLIPKLRWKEEYDPLSLHFDLGKEKYIAVHVDTETSQFYEKQRNWPAEKFRDLFSKIQKTNQKKIVLFGLCKREDFGEAVVDLRGKTTFLQMISIIKNYCSHLIAPDSGILCSMYYLDAEFPLKIVSLWGNPNQGVLRQNVVSPNTLLEHHPLVGKKKEVNNISVQEVLSSLNL